MMTRKHTMLVGLMLCAVALTALGSAKNLVERPLMVKATAVWIVDLATGSAQCVQNGEATHTGRFVAVGSGVWDLANFRIVSGGGIVTAANGDTLNWEMGPNNSVIFEGGTGRFKEASGGFDSEFLAPPDVVPGPRIGTVKVTVHYVGIGNITY